LGQAKREHGVRLEAEKRGIGVVVDGAVSPCGEVGGIPEVIPMAVGEEEGIGLDLFFLQEVEEAFGGIDGESVAVQVNKVSVGGGEAAAVAPRFSHGSSFLRPFVTVYDYVSVTRKRESR